MRIAVIGAGAMGGLFGGRLTADGQDVSLIDRPGPHLDRLQRDGLLLDTDGRTQRIAVTAGRAADMAGPHDLLIVFTKGPDTVAALGACTHLAGPGAAVLTLQNGLGHAGRIAAVLPTATILVGMTDWPADLRAPGEVASHGHGHVRIWAADRADHAVTHAVAAVLSGAGLNCTADPAVDVAIWEKVAFNAAMNTVTAVGRVTVGVLGDSADGRRLVGAVVDETLLVASAQGLAVDGGRVHAAVARAFAGHREHQSSMLQDVLAGRPTEIEMINGAIVQIAERVGVDTPVTRAMRDLVRLIDSAAGRRS